MDVALDVFEDRMEFSGDGRRVSVRLIEESAGPLWMTEFRMAADLIRRGLVKLGASGLQPLYPRLTICLRERDRPVSEIEKKALESAALIAGARDIIVKP